jgi:hypothetical protein
VLGPVLYTLFTADLPETPGILSATFADDTAALSYHRNQNIASEKLQTHLNAINTWMSKWKIQASASKSVHVTFTLNTGNCPSVQLGTETLPHSDVARYLGIYIDRKQTWKTHIKKKRDELNLRFRSLLWLLGRPSKLNLNNKLLIYKSILKLVWTHGIELWGTASNSNLEILHRFQNSVFRTILNAPWFTKSNLPPTLIPLSGVGTTCFSSCCDKIRQFFLRPAAYLTSTLLETGVGANDCKCNRDQRLSVPSEARRSSR